MRSESRLNKIVIRVDLELEDLIPEYLESRRNDILLFRDAMSRKDFDTVAQLAHNIKGSGGGYGFDLMSKLGGDIETASDRKDASSIEKSLTDLEYYLDHIEVVYK